MIDTVHFKVHNLKKHAKITAQLSTSDKKGETHAQIDQSILESFDGDKIRAILYHDRDGILPLRRRSSLFIPSSHYSISYDIDFQRDFIAFNVSVPKYTYSTNVLQYIPYYDQSAKPCYQMLRAFFEGFFKNYFVSTPDFSDVEICRVDLCYNQFFLNKQEALKYLDAQKELCVKYARSSSNKYRNYDTSLFYSTKRYSFKIYHKGTEFNKNDKKELANNNPKGFVIPELAHQADRILRYEMTFHRSGLDYVFKQDIVKNDDLAKNYNFIFTRMFNQNTRVATKHHEDFLSKTGSFFLNSIWENTNSKIMDYTENLNKLPFDLMLFECLFNRFWQKVKDYQLSVPLSVFDIKTKIDQANSTVDLKNTMRKKPKQKNSSGLLISSLLSQFVDIDTLKAYLPSSTFYDLKADLKKLGINMYNKNIGVPPPPLTYQEYKVYFGKYH